MRGGLFCFIVACISRSSWFSVIARLFSVLLSRTALSDLHLNTKHASGCLLVLNFSSPFPLIIFFFTIFLRHLHLHLPFLKPLIFRYPPSMHFLTHVFGLCLLFCFCALPKTILSRLMTLLVLHILVTLSNASPLSSLSLSFLASDYSNTGAYIINEQLMTYSTLQISMMRGGNGRLHVDAGACEVHPLTSYEVHRLTIVIHNHVSKYETIRNPEYPHCLEWAYPLNCHASCCRTVPQSVNVNLKFEIIDLVARGGCHPNQTKPISTPTR